MKLLKTFGLVLLGLAMANCTKEEQVETTLLPTTDNLFEAKMDFEKAYAEHLKTVKDWEVSDEATQQSEKAENQCVEIEKKLKKLSAMMPKEELEAYLDAERSQSAKANVIDTPCYDAYEIAFWESLVELSICSRTTINPIACVINLFNDVRINLNQFNACMEREYE